MDPLADIRARRGRLIALAEAQREALVRKTAPLRAAAGAADRALAVLRWLRARPLWIGAVAAALVALRPRRTLNWTGSALLLWRAWPVISAFLKHGRAAIR